MRETEKEQDTRTGRTRAIQNDERRRSLVLATYHLIAEKGLEKLRTRDIAARAGVNIATLHYHFASKEDLIRGVADHLLQVFSTPPERLLGLEYTTPWGHIQSMFLSMQYRIRETPEMFIVLSELVLRSLRDPSIQPALKALDDGWHSYLKQVITDGMQQGLFRADLDPESTATELIILMKGTTFHWITSAEIVNFDRVLKDVERLLLC